MSDLPFSNIPDQAAQGIHLGLMARQQKFEQAKMVMQMQQMQFEKDLQYLNSNAEILSKPGSSKLKQLAANNVLAIYRRQAPALGIDPTSIPQTIDYHDGLDPKHARNMVSMISMFKDGKISRDDLRIGLLDIGSQAMQESSLPGISEQIQKTGEEAIKDKFGPRARVTAKVGGKEMSLQENAPGSGVFEPVPIAQPGGGPTVPAVAPVPAPTGDMTKLTDVANLQNLLNSVAKNYNPSFVGPAAGRARGLLEKGNRISPEEANFRAAVDAHSQAAKSLLMTNPAAAKDAPAMPDYTMSPEQFTASMMTAKNYYTNKAKTQSDAMEGSGYAVPDATKTAAGIKPALGSFLKR